MKKRWAAWVIALVALAGGWAIMRVYVYSTEAGDVFPPYSSLRADPKGTRALHDSLKTLPGMRVTQWFKPLEQLGTAQAAVLIFNENPWTFRWASPSQRKVWEDAAGRGLRLVFALSPEPKKKPTQKKPDDKKPVEFDLEEQWKITLKPGESGGPVTLETSDPAWRFHTDGAAERAFGKGSIALVAETFPFSNEALRDDRDSPLILWALAGRSEIVFDEYHLGSQETGSVGMLLRRYHLEGAALGLVTLGLLFIWRMSSSFVPPQETRATETVAGRDSAAALASLLRRNVPPARLAATGLELWNHAAQLLPGISQERRARVERELNTASADLPALWRRIHEILTRRT